MVPKIHKPGKSGRPIVSSNGAPTENISRFVDYFLQPCVSTLPSYIRDTTEFLNRLRRLPTLPAETLLLTLDVTSLYTQGRIQDSRRGGTPKQNSKINDIHDLVNYCSH